MTKANSVGEREKTIIRTSIIGILANPQDNPCRYGKA